MRRTLSRSPFRFCSVVGEGELARQSSKTADQSVQRLFFFIKTLYPINELEAFARTNAHSNGFALPHIRGISVIFHL